MLTAKVQGLTIDECHLCSEALFEAWERMTYGGIVNETGPGIYSLEDCDNTVERFRVPNHVVSRL